MIERFAHSSVRGRVLEDPAIQELRLENKG